MISSGGVKLGDCLLVGEVMNRDRVEQIFEKANAIVAKMDEIEALDDLQKVQILQTLVVAKIQVEKEFGEQAQEYRTELDKLQGDIVSLVGKINFEVVKGSLDRLSEGVKMLLEKAEADRKTGTKKS